MFFGPLQPPVTCGLVWMTLLCLVCSPGRTNTWWRSLTGLQGNQTTTLSSMKTVSRCRTRWGEWEKQPYTLVKCISCYKYKDKIWPMCNLHGKIQAVHIIDSLQWNVVILMLISSLLQTGRWNDVSCAELNTYICKMPKAHYPAPSVKPTVYGCPQVGKKKHSSNINFSVFLSTLAPSYDASWKRFAVHVE